MCNGQLFAGTDIGGVNILSIDATTGLPRAVSGFALTSAADGPSTSMAVNAACSGVYLGRAGSTAVGAAPTFTTISLYRFLAPAPITTIDLIQLCPTTLALDPAGKFLFAAHAGTNHISVLSIDPVSGVLTRVAGSPFPTGASPSHILIANDVLYVTNAGDNTVSAFTWDHATGTLTALGAAPLRTGSHPVWMAAFSNFLFVANQGSNDVSIFTVQTGGLLQPTATATASVGAAPREMTVALGPQ